MICTECGTENSLQMVFNPQSRLFSFPIGQYGEILISEDHIKAMLGGQVECKVCNAAFAYVEHENKVVLVGRLRRGNVGQHHNRR